MNGGMTQYRQRYKNKREKLRCGIYQKLRASFTAGLMQVVNMGDLTEHNVLDNMHFSIFCLTVPLESYGVHLQKIS